MSLPTTTRPARRPMRTERLVTLRSTMPVQLVTLRHAVPLRLGAVSPEALARLADDTTALTTPKVERTLETAAGKGGEAR